MMVPNLLDPVVPLCDNTSNIWGIRQISLDYIAFMKVYKILEKIDHFFSSTMITLDKLHDICCVFKSQFRR